MSLIATREQIVCLSIQIRKWSEGAHSAGQKNLVRHHGGLQQQWWQQQQQQQQQAERHAQT
jgi:hypothetical protein